MRKATSLPFEMQFVGRLWNPQSRTGNYDTNRKPITTIVLHTIVGTVKGTTSHFKNLDVKSSAHYGIDSLGKITLWITEDATAYHSGRYEVNQESIGIEHEDNGKPNDPRTDALYVSSSALVADICKNYNIPCDRDHIKMHREVSASPTACPGTLNIDRIISGAYALLNPNQTLHNYQMPEQVFIDLVTKGTNLDNLLTALEFPPELGTRPDSYKEVLAYIQSFIVQEVARQKPVNDPQTMPSSTQVADGLTEQLNPKDKNVLLQLLSKLVGVLKKDII